jgi:hypothetical protein
VNQRRVLVEVRNEKAQLPLLPISRSREDGF